MIYVGKNGKAASVSAVKVGDGNGKALNVVGGWVGDENGKARRIWSGSDAFRFKVNGSGSITFSGNVEISDGRIKRRYTAAADETYRWGATAKTITIRGELTNIRFGRKLEEILSVFPASMSGVTDFTNAFNSCTSLTYIPPGLFDNCPNVTNFSSAFQFCTAITSAVPELWDTAKWPNVTGHSACFRDCTNAANYADIPADWK